MPRPKTTERRRCVKACDTCKGRKERCDGGNPCSRCKKRSKESSCTYHASNANVRRVSNTPLQPHQAVSDTEHPNSLTPNHSGDASTTHETLEGSTSTSTTSAPVPKHSRMVRDAKGGFIYIGDSASLSFLQNIRRIVAASIEPCSFTTDCHRHQIIESGPLVQYDGVDFTEPNVQVEEALGFTKQFMIAASGCLDLFDSQMLLDQCRRWAQDPLRSQWPNCSVFFLVLAIGAQAGAEGPTDDYAAETYFNFGRQRATMALMDDQSIFTVQSFSLITWYMVAACRRSAAVLNLGIAIQAAYTLGIHRNEANACFAKEDRICRERSWKTLRVCDIFLSASMGRPSTTSHIDQNVNSRNSPIQSGRQSPIQSDRHSPIQSDNQGHSVADGKTPSAILRLCLIVERILSEVYSKRTVTVELAKNISKQHREWTSNLPAMLKVDGLVRSDDLASDLGSANVIMAYYWSIILLTRPFLTFRVSSYKGYWRDQDGHSPDVTAYSDACVTSAIKAISKAYEVILYNGTPKRLPMIINSVFMSALALGLAYFGDYDCRGWPLEGALTQAKAVLTFFAACNPQAARYMDIIDMLWAAANQYRRHRTDNMLQSRSQRVSDLFGNADDSFSHMMSGLPTPGQTAYTELESLTTQQLGTVLDITTSGRLTTSKDMDFTADNNENIFMSSLGFSNLAYEDEMPIFWITDHFSTQS